MRLIKLKEIFEKFFIRIADFIIISKKINRSEIIIRTLLCPKHVSSNNIIEDRKLKDFFLPYLGGVSVDRYRYINENKLKIQAKKKFSGSQRYAGFAIFSTDVFDDSIDEYKTKYPQSIFFTSIYATPLDENENLIKDKVVFRWKTGNLAHADIINYDQEILLETPSTSCRNFSRILASNCIKLLDENPEKKNWTGLRFDH